MIKFHPKYFNFDFLNGDLDSFVEDTYSVFVLMPFGDDNEIRKELDDIFKAMKEVIEKDCLQGKKLSCSRADLEGGLIIMKDICRKIKNNCTIGRSIRMRYSNISTSRTLFYIK